MGLFERFFRRSTEIALPFSTYDPAQRVLPEPYEPFMGHYGSIPVVDPGVPLTESREAVDAIWRSQPNVRKVVDFIARNVASIPLNLYERKADSDRERVRDHPLAALLRQPRAGVGAFRFWHSVLSDSLLYDRWVTLTTTTDTGALELVQVPSWRVRLETDALRRVVRAWYWVGDESDRRQSDRDGWRELDLTALVFDHGYGPRTAGVSPMITLGDILSESAEAVHYRRQVWANGARVPAWIERPPPPGTPKWSQEARDRWVQGFRAGYTGDGSNAGGVPLMEDGMKLHDLKSFSPQDAMDLEGRHLTAVEVAGAFHVAPELVGARQGNYSNVREYRQMLYRDSLGPHIKALEEVLNSQLVPLFGDSRELYIEANVESKLRGDFIEQATVKSSATGAPWLTRNEARAMENRPPVDGGDDLVVPLNVLTGGQASPTDSGSQNRTVSGAPMAKAGSARVKATVPDAYRERVAGILADFFTRQGRTVTSRLGAGAEDWWDEQRWNDELAEDLQRVAVLVSTYIGEESAEALGFSAGDYNVDRTLNFLKAVSERVAGDINATTLAAIQEGIEGIEGGTLEAAEHVYGVAEESRAALSALTFGTLVAGFAAVEAGKQLVGSRGMKRWIVNSSNPRASHAAMNGETVPLSENFSNGMPWPGSIEGGVDEVAGCQCSLIVSVP